MKKTVKHEFNFSDVDEMLAIVHADCPQNDPEKGTWCEHYSDKAINRLMRTKVLARIVRAHIERIIMLKAAGASSEDVAEDLLAGLAHAFFSGALYARHKLLSAELARIGGGAEK